MKASNDFSCLALFGYVTEYDPQRHMAKVFFPDKNIISSWLPVIIPNAIKNHDELHVDENEHVACLMLGNGLETGFIIGAIYDDTNKPPVGNNDIRVLKFEDDTIIQYDRRNHKMLIDVQGEIEISATGNIRVNGARIDLN